MVFMGWSCSICSDGLHNSVDNGDVSKDSWKGANIMVTPCGHAFHSYCITRWLHGLAGANGSCPNCRKQIPRKICIPTFPDTYEVTLDESLLAPSGSSGSVSNEAAQKRINELTKLLVDERAKTEQLGKDLEDSKQMGEVLSVQCEDLTNQLGHEKTLSANFRAKFEVAKSYETLVTEKERELKALKEDRFKYMWIQDLLKGHVGETDRQMKQMTLDAESFRNIVECNNLLQSELQSSMNKIVLEKKGREEDLRLIGTYKREVEKLKKEVVELKSVVDDLNQQLKDKPKATSTFSGTASSSQKRNLRALDALDKTICISSDEEDVPSPSKRSRPITRTGLMVKKSTAAAPSAKQTAIRQLSPLSMRVRSNIPGVSPITPTVSSFSSRPAGGLLKSRLGGTGSTFGSRLGRTESLAAPKKGILKL